MIGKVIEGRYTGASVNKLLDKNFLFIETEDGERIALSKKNIVSITDVTDQYPSYGKKVMMVMWNDYETSLYQIGYSEEPRVQVNEITQSGEIQETSKRRVSKKKHISFGGVLAMVAAILVLTIVCFFLLKLLFTKNQNETAEVLSTEQSEAIEAAAPQNTEPPETVKTVTPEEIAYTAAEELVAEGKTAEAALAFGKLGDYADARERSLRLWHSLRKRRTIAEGNSDLYEKVFLGIKENGTVVAQGVNRNGECSVDDWSNIIEVYTNGYISFGLRKDGTIAMSDVTEYLQTDKGFIFDARKKITTIQTWTRMEHLYVTEEYEREIWGLTTDGKIYYAGYPETKPYLPEISIWTDIVEFYDCNRGYDPTSDNLILLENYLGLRMDGTVVHAGEDEGLKRAVESWHDIVKIKQVDIGFVVGWKSDGTMVSYGGPSTFTQEDFSDTVDIVGNSWKGYALLKHDGTVTTYPGSNYSFQEVENWKDIQAIYCYFHLIGITSDGTVLTARGTDFQKFRPKSGEWTNIADVYADDISIGLRNDGTVCVSEERYEYPLKPLAGIRLPGYEEVTPPEISNENKEVLPDKEEGTLPNENASSDIPSVLYDETGRLRKADEFIEIYDTILSTAYKRYYGKTLSIRKAPGSQLSNSYGIYIDGEPSGAMINFMYKGDDTPADNSFDQIILMAYTDSGDGTGSNIFCLTTLMSSAKPTVSDVMDSTSIFEEMLYELNEPGVDFSEYTVQGVKYKMSILPVENRPTMIFSIDISALQ